MISRLKPEQLAEIRTAFEQMQDREDLLNLLNRVCWMLEGSPMVVRVQDMIDAEEPLSWEIPDKYTNFITDKQLGFFASSFTERSKKRKRYSRFYITKKNGKQREINAPVTKLMEIQTALNLILQTLYTVQEPAFGFAAGKNIIKNAAGHIGKKFVLNVDIKDFFPSIYFRKVKIMLERHPFNLSAEREPLAFMIANLCTENGCLPQGAPTSPILTNIICQRLDKNLQDFAKKFNIHFTRYADDISFSSNEFVFTKRFMQELESILKIERFQLNTEKTRIQGRAYRQEVTGLTVNEKINVNRQFLRSYRTLLHLYNTKGPKAAKSYLLKRKAVKSNLRAIAKQQKVQFIKNVILGKYNFITQVKGKDSIKHPFENAMNITPVIVNVYNLPGKIYGIRHKLHKGLEYEIDEQLTRINKAILDDSVSIVSEDAVQYGIVEPKNKQLDNLIEKILNEWSGDKEKGFEKAMRLLKQQLDEQ